MSGLNLFTQRIAIFFYFGCASPDYTSGYITLNLQKIT